MGKEATSCYYKTGAHVESFGQKETREAEKHLAQRSGNEDGKSRIYMETTGNPTPTRFRWNGVVDGLCSTRKWKGLSKGYPS